MIKILCIGHAAYDITLPMDEFPTENKKVRIGDVIECGGGSSAIAATLLARWGMEVSFVGMIGNDYYGNKIKEEFAEDNVETKFLESTDKIKTTGSYIIASRANGSRTIISSRTKNISLEDIELDFEPDFIYSDGEEVSLTKIYLERYPNAKSILDAGGMKPEILELGPLVDYFVCSKDFAEDYTKSKIDVKNPNTIIKCYDNIVQNYQNNVIITLEASGSFTKIGEDYVIVPSIPPERIEDSTGAGDIYHGALTYFIINNVEIKRAMRLANIAGALSLEHTGGKMSIPTLQRVLDKELEYDRKQ